MYMLQMSFLLPLLMCLMLMCIYKCTMYKFTGLSKNKQTPFECGFESFNLMRRSFSMRFFILIVLFLIFDVETILFMPMLLKLTYVPNNINVLINMFFFLIILISGLLYEWKNGMLDWSIS